MIELRIGPNPGASDFARGRNNTAGVVIGILGLVLTVPTAALARAQSSRTNSEVFTPVSRKTIMTQLTTADAPATAPATSLSLEPGGDERIRPFRVQVPDTALVDLSHRGALYLSTRTVAVPALSPLVAVITTEPAFTPTTRPALSTVATRVSLLAQATGAPGITLPRES